MKRIFALLLTAVLVLSLLVGCGSGSSDKPDDKTSPDQENAEFVYDSSKASWEQDTSPIELEWFVAYDWIDLGFDPDNNEFDKWIYTDTGITIKYTIGSQEKLNVLMATGNLPDIVTYDAVSTERENMENSGMLLPLDDLMEKYAPDMQVSDGMMNWYRNENDGKWYVWVSYFSDLEEYEKEGVSLESHNMNYARKDIMEALNIDPASMTTKEGFIAALQTVKDSGYTYNGQTVIPFIGDEVEYLAEQFGMDREDAEGNLLNAKRQPEYLEALLFLNEIYTKGLSTDEIFTMDTTLRRQLVTSGSVFAGLRQNYLNGKDDLFYTDNNALMMGVGHITGDSGKEAIVSPSTTAGWAATMITTNCKNPQRAISLLSFLTQPDVSLSYYYGGVNGYDIIDGQAVTKPERQEERMADTTAYDAKYKSSIQDCICNYMWVKKYMQLSNMDALTEDLYNYTNK